MRPKSKDNSIKIFALASFLHDMGSDIVFSVWPVFVTQVLGANMSILGLIDWVGDALVSISQAVSGYLSDRWGKRKIFVWVGYLFGGVARIGYALSPSWQWLIPFRMLDRSGKIRGSPRDAIVSDLSTNADRGRNFGLLRAMDNLGAVFGILISLFFLKYLGYTKLFLFAAIPSFIAVVMLILFTKEAGQEKRIFKGLSFASFDRNLKTYMFLSALFSLGSFSYSFLIVASQRSGIHIESVIGLYLLFTLVASIFSYPFGKLSDSIGRKKILYLSFLCWGLTTLLFIIWNTYLGLILAFILYGLHRAALEPVQKTMVAEFSEKTVVASTLGAFQMVIGLCALPASILAGILWDTISPQAPFYLSLFLTAIAGILLTRVRETKKSSSP